MSTFTFHRLPRRKPLYKRSELCSSPRAILGRCNHGPKLWLNTVRIAFFRLQSLSEVLCWGVFTNGLQTRVCIACRAFFHRGILGGGGGGGDHGLGWRRKTYCSNNTLEGGEGREILQQVPERKHSRCEEQIKTIWYQNAPTCLMQSMDASHSTNLFTFVRQRFRQWNNSSPLFMI